MKKSIMSTIVSLLLLSACADNDNGNFYSTTVVGKHLNASQCAHLAEIGPEVNTNQTCDNYYHTSSAGKIAILGFAYDPSNNIIGSYAYSEEEKEVNALWGTNNEIPVETKTVVSVYQDAPDRISNLTIKAADSHESFSIEFLCQEYNGAYDPWILVDVNKESSNQQAWAEDGMNAFCEMLHVEADYNRIKGVVESIKGVNDTFTTSFNPAASEKEISDISISLSSETVPSDWKDVIEDIGDLEIKPVEYLFEVQ